MIGTTLQAGLDELAKGLAHMYPGTTGVEMRAVWDKVVAGTALSAGFEAAAGLSISDNRALLDSLVALEEKPTRTTIETQALDALSSLRTYRDLANPSNAQTAAVIKLLCRVSIGLIRLALRRFDAAD